MVAHLPHSLPAILSDAVAASTNIRFVELSKAGISFTV